MYRFVSFRGLSMITIGWLILFYGHRGIRKLTNAGVYHRNAENTSEPTTTAGTSRSDCDHLLAELTSKTKLNTEAAEKSAAKINVNRTVLRIPELKEGGTNLAEVLYVSSQVLSSVYGDSTFLQPDRLKKDCLEHGQKVCEAVEIFTKHIRDSNFTLVSFINTLGTLKTREFASVPRPENCTGCFRFAFKTVRRPRARCAENDHVSAFVLITSVPVEVDQRAALRDTWLRRWRNNTGVLRYAFVLGTGWTAPEQSLLDCEADHYGDILQIDFRDTYYNLSIKMASGFKWVADHCPRAQFVVRSAGDIYLNVPWTLGLVRGQGQSSKGQRGVFGHCFRGDAVLHEGVHKHFQTFNDYPHQAYGPFCSGSTYLMSMNSTRKFLATAGDVPWFNLEDIWVGMVARRARLPLRNVEGFNRKLTVPIKQKCATGSSWFTFHEVPPEDMRSLYQQCLRDRETGTNDLLEIMNSNVGRARTHLTP